MMGLLEPVQQLVGNYFLLLAIYFEQGTKHALSHNEKIHLKFFVYYTNDFTGLPETSVDHQSIPKFSTIVIELIGLGERLLGILTDAHKTVIYFLKGLQIEKLRVGFNYLKHDRAGEESPVLGFLHGLLRILFPLLAHDL